MVISRGVVQQFLHCAFVYAVLLYIFPWPQVLLVRSTHAAALHVSSVCLGVCLVSSSVAVARAAGADAAAHAQGALICLTLGMIPLWVVLH